MMERITHKVLIRTEINAQGERCRTFANLEPPHQPNSFCECDPIREVISEEGTDRVVLYIHHHSGENT